MSPILPAAWFANQLMVAMGLPYYVGLLSAAAIHGASHHQPQEFQIVTSKPVRLLVLARQRLHFIVRTHLNSTPFVPVRTPTGNIRVSTPEATAIDLVRFNKWAGGFGNAGTIIGELVDKMTSGALISTAEQMGELTAAQRLGYLLDLLGARALGDSLADWIALKRPRFMPLSPGVSMRHAPRDERWRLFVNDTLEVEM